MPSEQPPTRVGTCTFCGGDGVVTRSFGINDSGRPEIVPCPSCQPAPPSEQPREGTRVEKCRCGFPFYEDRFTIPQLDDGSVPDAWEFCPYCGGRLDEPAQPRGEGDDLAARLKQEAMQIRASRDGVFSDGMAEGLDRAASIARASTHPEQPARIVGAALDLLDSLGAPHYHDLIGTTYTLHKEQADKLRTATRTTKGEDAGA